MRDAALIAFAHQLADAAGAAIRPYFGVAVAVETKADDSPVSIADRAAEAAMRTLIAEHYPTHGIYGEEYGVTEGAGFSVLAAGKEDAATTSEPRTQNPEPTYTWVIDPIDGTRAFLAGQKEWGTLIALCENGVPILGVLDQPITGERWLGTQGVATYFNSSQSNRAERRDSVGGEICNVRGVTTFSGASISSTSARYFTPPQAKAFVALAEQCAEVIENGDCYAYGLLARGQRDLVLDAGLKPYDILALVPIVQAAGGTITQWNGAPVTLTGYANVVAAGDARLHQEALDVLRKSL